MSRRIRCALSALLLTIACVWPAWSANADANTSVNANATTEMDTDEIVDAIERNQAFKTVAIDATIVTTDRLGSSTQKFSSYGRENGDTLVVVTAGADTGQKVLRKGTSIYLYYPDAEEVIRLQGSALKDSFMGSDFSYEDLTGDNGIRDNYTAELLETVRIDGHDCYHMMFTAKNRKQTYQKQESYIDAELFVSRRSILYSASGRALREITSSEFVTEKGFVFATSSIMKDLMKTNSSTIMTVESVQVDISIPDSYFSKDELVW